MRRHTEMVHHRACVIRSPIAILQERRLRRTTGSRSLSLSLAEHPFANGDLPDVLSPRHSFLSPKASHASTPIGSPMARLTQMHSFGPCFISDAPSVPSSVFDSSMTVLAFGM